MTADLLPEIGIGICAASNWLTVVAVIFSFPYMIPNDGLGLANTFTIYTCITFAYIVFNFLFLKETKNKTYLEIEKQYQTWF